MLLMSLSHFRAWFASLEHPMLVDASLTKERQCHSGSDSGYLSYYRDIDRTDISSLPPELLREIFLLSVDLIPHFIAIRMNASPFNISQTCRLWRDLATNTPLLWTRICIPPTISSQLLRIWVDRSQGLPLSIELPVFTPFRPQHEATIIRILRSCISQWEEVSVDFCDELWRPGGHGFLLTQPPSSFPSLRSIKWRVQGTHECFEQFWQQAHRIPTIQHVHFQQTPQECPWHQLTRLALESPNGMDRFASTIRILPQCTNLAVLHWDFWPSDEEIDIRILVGAPVVIPNLTDFRVSLSEQGGAFLDHFTLPSIRRICWDEDPSFAVVVALGNLLRRSDAKLEALQIPFFAVHHTHLDTMVLLLRQPFFDQLQLLFVHSINPTRVFWEVLKDPTFLPALRSLRWAVGGPLVTLLPARIALQERLSFAHLEDVSIFIPCTSFCRKGGCICRAVPAIARDRLSDLVKLRTVEFQEGNKLDIIPRWYTP